MKYDRINEYHPDMQYVDPIDWHQITKDGAVQVNAAYDYINRGRGNQRKYLYMDESSVPYKDELMENIPRFGIILLIVGAIVFWLNQLEVINLKDMF